MSEVHTITLGLAPGDLTVSASRGPSWHGVRGPAGEEGGRLACLPGAMGHTFWGLKCCPKATKHLISELINYELLKGVSELQTPCSSAQELMVETP